MPHRIIATALLPRCTTLRDWVWLRRQHVKRGDGPVCRGCGYPVRQRMSNTCPECGEHLMDVGVVDDDLALSETGQEGHAAMALLVLIFGTPILYVWVSLVMFAFGAMEEPYRNLVVDDWGYIYTGYDIKADDVDAVMRVRFRAEGPRPRGAAIHLRRKVIYIGHEWSDDPDFVVRWRAAAVTIEEPKGDIDRNHWMWSHEPDRWPETMRGAAQIEAVDALYREKDKRVRVERLARVLRGSDRCCGRTRYLPSGMPDGVAVDSDISVTFHGPVWVHIPHHRPHVTSEQYPIQWLLYRITFLVACLSLPVGVFLFVRRRLRRG